MTMTSWPVNVALGYNGPEDIKQWDAVANASLRDPTPPEVAHPSISVVGRGLLDAIPTWAHPKPHPPEEVKTEEEEHEETPTKPAAKPRASRAKKPQPEPPTPEAAHVGPPPAESPAESSGAAEATHAQATPKKTPPKRPKAPAAGKYYRTPEEEADIRKESQAKLAKLGAQKGLPKKPAESPFKPPKPRGPSASPSPKKGTPSKKVGGKVQAPARSTRSAQAQVDKMLQEPQAKKPRLEYHPPHPVRVRRQ